MKRSTSARAPKGASGTCRERRRRQGARRPEWVRPFRRVRRALDATVRLIESTLRTVAESELCAQERPVRTSQELLEAYAWLVTASERLAAAARQIAETNACIGRQPELLDDAPELVIRATQRWIAVAAWLSGVADEVLSLHRDVLDGLASGTLVAEALPARRPRIVLAPRRAALRAFLRTRQARVTDRIASLLRRRGRTPRPPALRVPQRSALGRAPPPSPAACSDHRHRP